MRGRNPELGGHLYRSVGNYHCIGSGRRLHRDGFGHSHGHRKHLQDETHRYHILDKSMTSFQRFAELCQKVEGVSGSLEKIDLVAAFLADLDEDELAIASSFIMGTLFSPSLDLVIGVGPSILYEALARACGCSIEQISDMLRATGDPGLVAAAVVEKRKPIGFAAFVEEESLSITDVYQRFLTVARASGKRSQGAKVKNLQFLFSQANPLEAQYIARLAIEDMRIGVGEGGVRDAIARAFARDAADVERAFNLTNDMGLVAVSASAARSRT